MAVVMSPAPGVVLHLQPSKAVRSSTNGNSSSSGFSIVPHDSSGLIHVGNSGSYLYLEAGSSSTSLLLFHGHLDYYKY